MFSLRILILAFLLFAQQLHSQINHEWHFGIGGTGQDNAGNSKMDDHDNLYTALEFEFTADIDPGPATDLVFPQRGRVASYTKLNADGQLLWHQEFYGGPDSYLEIYDLNYNKAVLAINFEDSLVYVHNGKLETLFRFPGHSTCLITMTLDGSIIDKRRFSVSEDFYFADILLLEDGSMIATASFYNTLSLPGTSISMTSFGKSDGILMQIDEDLNFVWAKQFGGPGYEAMSTICIKDEKIYYAFNYRDTMFVPMPQSILSLPCHGGEDFIFGYMDMKGNIQQLIPMGGDGFEEVRTIKVDDEGNIYIGGAFENTMDFAGLSSQPEIYESWKNTDGFIAKYTANGHFLWNRVYRDTYYGGIYSIQLERGNELYASGGFSDTADLNPGIDSIFITNTYNSQGYITKLNTDGDFQWSYWFRSPQIMGIREINVSSETGRIYLDGFYTDSLNCTQLPEEKWIQCRGNSDIFMMAFSEDNVISATLQSMPQDMLLYPNPASEIVYIETQDELSSIALFDAQGRLIHTDAVNQTKGQIDIRHLSPGSYFIKVQTAAGAIMKKFIKV